MSDNQFQNLQERLAQSEVFRVIRYIRDDFSSNFFSKKNLQRAAMGAVVGISLDYLLPRFLPAEPLFAFESVPNMFVEASVPVLITLGILEDRLASRLAGAYLGSLVGQAVNYYFVFR